MTTGGRLYPISEIASRVGMSEETLRSWERRYGFPKPTRTRGGQRRYTEDDLAALRRVVKNRDAGMSLASAIAHALEPHGASVPPSFLAYVLERHPDLTLLGLSHRALAGMSRALEDEFMLRDPRGPLVGVFQREAQYRREEERWRRIARVTSATVLSAFPGLSLEERGPALVPVPAAAPASREWAVIAMSPGFAACLLAWEPPRAADAATRRFEACWSASADVVRDAFRVAHWLVRQESESLADRLRAALPPVSTDRGGGEARIAAGLANRMLAYVTAPDAP
jgi:MerR family transcriptional regulator, light-induced transcriptional regulator